MNKKTLKNLVNYLERTIVFHPFRTEILNCSSKLRLSRYFFEMCGCKKEEIEKHLIWLERRGGHCDCEVLLNVIKKVK